MLLYIVKSFNIFLKSKKCLNQPKLVLPGLS